VLEQHAVASSDDVHVVARADEDMDEGVQHYVHVQLLAVVRLAVRPVEQPIALPAQESIVPCGLNIVAGLEPLAALDVAVAAPALRQVAAASDVAEQALVSPVVAAQNYPFDYVAAVSYYR